MGMTVEQAEKWLDDEEEIVTQYGHFLKLCFCLGAEWADRNIMKLECDLLRYGYSMSHVSNFRDRAIKSTKYGSDGYVKELMNHKGYKGSPIGIY